MKFTEEMADAAVVILQQDNGHIILVRRRFSPYKGYWSLPGGLLEGQESPKSIAIREAKEETGLDIKVIRLVAVYEDPYRTPSGYCACYIAKVKGGAISSGREVLRVSTFATLPPASKIAFNQARMLRDAGFDVSDKSTKNKY